MRRASRASMLILSILLLTLPTTASSQSAATGSWLDKVREATVALGSARMATVAKEGVQTTKAIFALVGSGVIIGVDDRLLLITAKHVLYDPSKGWDPDKIRIRFAWFEDRSVDDYLGVEVPLKKDGKRLWVEHPSADLAGMRLHIPIVDAGRTVIQGLPTSIFAVDADLFEGAQIVVLGYPSAVGSAFWTRAVVRGGTVAWVNPNNAILNPLLIDSQIFPGNSGGPVLRVPIGIDKSGDFRWPQGGKIAFLGIVSWGPLQDMPLATDKERTKIEIQGPKGREVVVAPQLMGLSVIEPAARVRQLIDLLK